MRFKDLDPILHQQLRLQIISLLAGTEKAEFNFLLEETGASKGNLSIQIKKLQEVGYIEVVKGYRNNYPLTECSLTPKGRMAFEIYVDSIENYFRAVNKDSGKKKS